MPSAACTNRGVWCLLVEWLVGRRVLGSGVLAGHQVGGHRKLRAYVVCGGRKEARRVASGRWHCPPSQQQLQPALACRCRPPHPTPCRCRCRPPIAPCTLPLHTHPHPHTPPHRLTSCCQRVRTSMLHWLARASCLSTTSSSRQQHLPARRWVGAGSRRAAVQIAVTNPLNSPLPVVS